MGLSTIAKYEVGCWEVGWCLEDWDSTVFLFYLSFLIGVLIAHLCT